MMLVRVVSPQTLRFHILAFDIMCFSHITELSPQRIRARRPSYPILIDSIDHLIQLVPTSRQRVSSLLDYWNWDCKKKDSGETIAST